MCEHLTNTFCLSNLRGNAALNKDPANFPISSVNKKPVDQDLKKSKRRLTGDLAQPDSFNTREMREKNSENLIYLPGSVAQNDEWNQMVSVFIII